MSTIAVTTHPPNLRVLRSGLIPYIYTFCHLFLLKAFARPEWSPRTVWIAPRNRKSKRISNPMKLLEPIPWSFSFLSKLVMSCTKWSLRSLTTKSASVMSSYTSLLLELSNSLTTANLQKLKFLCEDVIPAGRLERINRGIELFGVLEQLDMLYHCKKELLIFSE